MTPDALIAIVLAPLVGSFLGTVIERLPAGRPVVTGRSACDHCGRTLGVVELVPILSYLLQRGRCRSCDGRLSPSYPLIELAAIAVALSAVPLLSGWLLVASLSLGWSLLVLAAIDARHRILPDAITLPLIPIGLAVTWLHAPGQLVAHLVGAVLGFLGFAAIAQAYRLIRRREGLGLGDAKLLSVAGAWLGWAPLPGLVVVAASAALAVALVRPLAGDRAAPTDDIAFGPYLALAIWISWLAGPIIIY